MTEERVEFRVSPDRYRHWRVSYDGSVATLVMDVDEQGGLVPGYELKLNSYDLGVDIELYDAVQRLRFEHPEVRTVVLTSGKPKIFCAGANIRMLAASAHGWKVNFCKFTNETRNGMEDSSRNDGLKFLAAVNGTCAGGVAPKQGRRPGRGEWLGVGHRLLSVRISPGITRTQKYYEVLTFNSSFVEYGVSAGGLSRRNLP